LQVQRLAGRFLVRKARDVRHLVRATGIVDPTRQHGDLRIAKFATKVKRIPKLLGNGWARPRPGEQHRTDPISF
jgi:hypothetical protein